MPTQMDLLSDALTPGAWSHNGAQPTSAEAAEAIRPELGRLQHECLKRLANTSLSPDEVARSLSRSVLSIRPRFTELAEAGLIFPTGDRATNDSGRHAMRYTATKAGRALLAQLEAKCASR